MGQYEGVGRYKGVGDMRGQRVWAIPITTAHCSTLKPGGGVGCAHVHCWRCSLLSGRSYIAKNISKCRFLFYFIFYPTQVFKIENQCWLSLEWLSWKLLHITPLLSYETLGELTFSGSPQRHCVNHTPPQPPPPHWFLNWAICVGVLCGWSGVAMTPADQSKS